MMLVVLLFVSGLVLAHHYVDPGIEEFQKDRLAYAVAKEAYSMAWLHRDNPIQRLLAPAAKVVLVERRAGHCKELAEAAATNAIRMIVPPDPGVRLRADPGGAADPSWSEQREYVARVRFYTSFGIPTAAMNLTCGGLSASYEPLP